VLALQLHTSVATSAVHVMFHSHVRASGPASSSSLSTEASGVSRRLSSRTACTTAAAPLMLPTLCMEATIGSLVGIHVYLAYCFLLLVG
jgi:hypothetical protein